MAPDTVEWQYVKVILLKPAVYNGLTASPSSQSQGTRSAISVRPFLISFPLSR